MTDLSEIGILGKETVAGMNGVGIRDLCRRKDAWDVEVTFFAGRRSDADRFVGEPHMQRIPVGGRIHGDCSNAQLLAGPNDPQGDLPPISDQDLIEHASAFVAREGESTQVDQKQGLIVFDGLSVLHQDLDDGPLGVSLDLVHELHGFDNAQDLTGSDLLPFGNVGVGIG